MSTYRYAPGLLPASAQDLPPSIMGISWIFSLLPPVALPMQLFWKLNWLAPECPVPKVAG